MFDIIQISGERADYVVRFESIESAMISHKESTDGKKRIAIRTKSGDLMESVSMPAADAAAAYDGIVRYLQTGNPAKTAP